MDAVEARVDGLTVRVDRIEADGQQVRAELARIGEAAGLGVIAPVINPERRKPKMTAEQRRAIRQQSARKARAAKQVGTGHGAVRSAKTKKKLADQAKGRGK